jgi:prepilin-type N-terminal cleavage/methylation domain-containing protein
MIPRTPGRFERRRRGFTLVELLVVVGLMAVVMAVTIAGLQSSSGGAKMRTALLQLKSTLSLARQYAITRREPIFVTFPEAGDLAVHWNNNVELRNRLSYQAYNVWSPSDGYISEWIYLPRGVIFHWTMAPVNGSIYNVFRPGTVANENRFNITAGTSSGPTIPSHGRMPCVAFLPNGRLNQTGGKTIEVFLREGILDPANPTIAITQQFRRVQSVYVRPLTGQASYREEN